MEVSGSALVDAPSGEAATPGTSPKRLRDQDMVSETGGGGGSELCGTELQGEQSSSTDSSRVPKRRRRSSRKSRRRRKRAADASTSGGPRSSPESSSSRSGDAHQSEYTQEWKRKKVLDFDRFPKVCARSRNAVFFGGANAHRIKSSSECRSGFVVSSQDLNSRPDAVQNYASAGVCVYRRCMTPLSDVAPCQSGAVVGQSQATCESKESHEWIHDIELLLLKELRPVRPRDVIIVSRKESHVSEDEPQAGAVSMSDAPSSDKGSSASIEGSAATDAKVSDKESGSSGCDLPYESELHSRVRSELHAAITSVVSSAATKVGPQDGSDTTSGTANADASSSKQIVDGICSTIMSMVGSHDGERHIESLEKARRPSIKSEELLMAPFLGHQKVYAWCLNFPGGKREKNDLECPRRTAVREFDEETSGLLTKKNRAALVSALGSESSSVFSYKSGRYLLFTHEVGIDAHSSSTSPLRGLTGSGTDAPSVEDRDRLRASLDRKLESIPDRFVPSDRFSEVKWIKLSYLLQRPENCVFGRPLALFFTSASFAHLLSQIAAEIDWERMLSIINGVREISAAKESLDETAEG